MPPVMAAKIFTDCKAVENPEADHRFRVFLRFSAPEN